MKIPAFKFLCSLSLIATTGFAAGGSLEPDPEIQQIAGYRQWKRVTEQTRVVSAAAARG